MMLSVRMGPSHVSRPARGARAHNGGSALHNHAPGAVSPSSRAQFSDKLPAVLVRLRGVGHADRVRWERVRLAVWVVRQPEAPPDLAPGGAQERAAPHAG